MGPTCQRVLGYATSSEEDRMRGNRLSEEHIIGILKEAEADVFLVPVRLICLPR